jgi:ABC-type glycerol-3-phosphate transport system substrate-binding protein
MTRTISILLASLLAFAGTSALAADPPKDAPAKKAQAALVKPANVTDDAWAKMSDAEKAKAVEVSKKKKEKKGGC